ncbi:MAG TPA: fused MFS/spermidine synthase [Bryobacteraceae bacterium]
MWSTCLVFYQVALLAGYVYARVLANRLRAGAQSAIHLVVLAASLALLPIGPGESWKTASTAHPSWLIFRMLAATIGLTFVALSATSPLLQSWLARGKDKEPYRLFAVSNFASLAALIAYPLLIEPFLGTEQQRIVWSALYAAFAVLCGIATWHSRDVTLSRALVNPTASAKWEWFALAAIGSMLLLSITNHVDANVAAVPLIWVLPLAIYLLSFVVTFGARNIYRQALWIRLLAFALGILGYAIYNINAQVPIQVSLTIFLCCLFVCCVFCHGELNRLRPPAETLTKFYLLIAAGGATGAILIGIVAPHVFSGVYELPVTLLATALLALALTWHGHRWPIRLLWVAVSGCLVAVIVMNVQGYREGTLSLRRSFYGSLRVVQTPRAGPEQQRILFHGTIEHGSQFLQPPRRQRPTAYYGPDSGAGILLRECSPSPKRVAVVGLGAGTLAAYGKRGDEFDFYEINSQVADIAQSLFFYTRESQAHVEIKIGDGRLLLERETAVPFDALVLDAFSGDAIPVHLLTAEAFQLYQRHLAPGGTIAFHVSNDFLDLAPVVKQLAAHAGMQAVLVHNHSDEDDAILPADWILVTRNRLLLDNASIQAHAKPVATNSRARLWTDDYNNILQVFKPPRIRR